jgi:TnpA family transposase
VPAASTSTTPPRGFQIHRRTNARDHYLRAETYAAANSPLIGAQADIGLAQAWGGGLVAAVDGIRFVVPVRSVDARPNPKYFGRRRGATWLNLLNDQAVGLAAMVVSGTPRDSLHVIDLLYRQEAGRRPEVIVGDTGSYSDMVFALLRLLGFDSPSWPTCPTPSCGASTSQRTTERSTVPPGAGSTWTACASTGATSAASSPRSTPGR